MARKHPQRLPATRVWPRPVARPDGRLRPRRPRGHHLRESLPTLDALDGLQALLDDEGLIGRDLAGPARAPPTVELRQQRISSRAADDRTPRPGRRRRTGSATWRTTGCTGSPGCRVRRRAGLRALTARAGGDPLRTAMGARPGASSEVKRSTSPRSAGRARLHPTGRRSGPATRSAEESPPTTAGTSSAPQPPRPATHPHLSTAAPLGTGGRLSPSFFSKREGHASCQANGTGRGTRTANEIQTHLTASATAGDEPMVEVFQSHSSAVAVMGALAGRRGLTQITMKKVS